MPKPVAVNCPACNHHFYVPERVAKKTQRACYERGFSRGHRGLPPLEDNSHYTRGYTNGCIAKARGRGDPYLRPLKRKKRNAPPNPA